MIKGDSLTSECQHTGHTSYRHCETPKALETHQVLHGVCWPNARRLQHLVWLLWPENESHHPPRASCEVNRCGALSVYQGYPTVDQAIAAFRYAQTMGWYQVLAAWNLGSTYVINPAPVVPHLLATREEYCNPINPGCVKHWYMVYRGLQPGLYSS